MTWNKWAIERELTTDIYTHKYIAVFLLSSGIFPEPDKDPVIQIANMVQLQGQREPCMRNVFCLNTCAPIVGAEVKSYQKEGDMLEVKMS